MAAGEGKSVLDGGELVAKAETSGIFNEVPEMCDALRTKA